MAQMWVLASATVLGYDARCAWSVVIIGIKE